MPTTADPEAPRVVPIPSEADHVEALIDRMEAAMTRIEHALGLSPWVEPEPRPELVLVADEEGKGSD